MPPARVDNPDGASVLLLVTIGLVLVGAVSLVIGFVSNSLPPIYLSIACSVIAGIVLVVFSRMSKRQEAGGPSSSGFTPAPSAGSWAPPPSPPPPPPAPSYRAPATPAAEPAPSGAPAGRAAAAAPAVAVEDFPIEGYDTLRVSQILPALDELDVDDLDTVREREEQGKNRTTVLRRIDVLMDEGEVEKAPVAGATVPEMDDDDLDDDEGLEAETEDNFADVADVDDEEDLSDDDMAVAEDEGTAVIPAVAPGDSSFPIPDYDRLPVAQILPLLDDLDDDELDMVAEREEQGKNRAAILDRIDDMFEPLEGEAPAPIPIPAPPPPVKRAPAKKAVAKKVVAKKAPAVKAGPAKRTAIKKAAVKRAAPVKRPSPVTRTGTKKAVPAKRPPTAVKKVARKR